MWKVIAAISVAGLAVAIGVAVYFHHSSAPGGSPPATTAPPAAGGPAPCRQRSCRFPGAASTGVPARTTLRAVPGQVTSGPGWTWSPSGHSVQVTQPGVTISNLAIRGTLNITADNVTVQDVRVTAPTFYGISLRHTTGVTITNSTVSGSDTSAGRVSAAIADLYGDSTGMVITSNNISEFKTAIQVTTGLIAGNYIHDPGFVAGDHTNGIFDTGTTQPLMIYHNTILISRGETDAISLDATDSGQTIANKTVEDNLIGGGSYTIYGGHTHNNASSHILVENNVFSQAAYASSGQYGPAAYYNSAGTGNIWSGNTWDTTGRPVPAPGSGA